VAQAAMLRARAVIDLAEALRLELESQGGTLLVRDVELPLLRTLATMERTGIAVDTDLLDELWRGFDDRVSTAASAAYDVIGKQINLGSPKQLQTVLFDELHMPRTRKLKSGHTTDADALEGLYAKTTATPSGCGRPSRGCRSRSLTTAGCTRRTCRRSPRRGG